MSNIQPVEITKNEIGENRKEKLIKGIIWGFSRFERHMFVNWKCPTRIVFLPKRLESRTNYIKQLSGHWTVERAGLWSLREERHVRGALQLPKLMSRRDVWTEAQKEPQQELKWPCGMHRSFSREPSRACIWRRTKLTLE